MTISRRTLGNTLYEVSEIGFGAWAIGDAWGDLVPEAQARETLHAAMDAGMNFIDTADVYGGGRSEKLIGSVLRERKDRIYVATKMGRWPHWEDTYESMEKAARDALARLGVECLDLVQLHCIPTETLMAGRVFENLEKLKGQGLIRHYGASIETIDEGLFCIRNSSAVTLQVIFNLFRQRVVRDLLQAAAANKVGVIARVPLASGLLTGKYTRTHVFNDKDHRHFNANGEMFNVGETFAGVPFEKGVAYSGKLAGILADEAPEATLAQKALRWILDHDAVSTVIPGAKSPQQALENAEASGLAPLAPATHEKLAEYYWKEIDAEVRGVY